MYGKESCMFVSEGVTGTLAGKVVPIEEVISPDCAVIKQSDPPVVLPIPKGKVDALEHFAGLLYRTATTAMQHQEQIAPEPSAQAEAEIVSVDNVRATAPKLGITLTDGSNSWVDSFVPKNLSELAEYLADKAKGYRRFPEDEKNYYRDVPILEEPSITCKRRGKNPRMVGARLGLAKITLRNVHWWLDEHRVPDRPMPETPTEDEEEAGRQLSSLLIWLEKAAKESAAPESSAPVPDDGASAVQVAIYCHGGRSYSVDGQSPTNVSPEQHNFLKAFLNRDVALDTKELGKEGVSNVSKVASKINELFPGSVKPPARKGAGYYVRVRSLTLSR